VRLRRMTWFLVVFIQVNIQRQKIVCSLFGGVHGCRSTPIAEIPADATHFSAEPSLPALNEFTLEHPVTFDINTLLDCRFHRAMLPSLRHVGGRPPTCSVILVEPPGNPQCSCNQEMPASHLDTLSRHKSREEIGIETAPPSHSSACRILTVASGIPEWPVPRRHPRLPH